MTKRFFCTYFDSNYLPQALSLHASLTSHCINAHFFMVCMDDNSIKALTEIAHHNITVIRISDIEAAMPELAVAKKNRTPVEYFYTCSAAICYYLMTFKTGVHEITYLDADLYFFGNPEPIFQEIGDASIGIIHHRFSFTTKRNEKYGKFNVGWITFRRDPTSIQCLTEWKDNCIEWCYQYVEKDRYADQKYLDCWPQKYRNVHIINHKGANLAIWNIGNYKISKDKNGIWVDDYPLIFYHFANFKQLAARIFKTDLSKVFVRLAGVIRNDIYVPYALSIIGFSRKDIQIKSKADIHVKGLTQQFRKLTHRIREFFFPDILKL